MKLPDGQLGCRGNAVTLKKVLARMCQPRHMSVLDALEYRSLVARFLYTRHVLTWR